MRALAQRLRHPRAKAAVSFFLTFFLCSGLIFITVLTRMNVERLTMELLIGEKSNKAYEVISRLLYKTQALATAVIQNGGDIENFDRIAAAIVDDPVILCIAAAPEGVVRHVYPLEGNEALVGFNLLTEGVSGNQEAIRAVALNQLVFGGPFDLVQGGQALVGRLPVWIDGPDGRYFWGLVSIALRYPEVLDNAGLNELHVQGFAYEVWRINPDTNEKQVITGSALSGSGNPLYIEKAISILNAEWYFRILPIRAWYEYPETWALILLSACISFLVSFVMQNNGELKLLKTKFESMARTDGLTGIYNRRHFMEAAAAQLERTDRAKTGAYVIMFDLDNFKRINDTYGHLSGDTVLKETARRVRMSIRPYDLFARYGGEEFVLLVTDINREDAYKLADRIRQNISASPVMLDGAALTICASFGVAPATSAGDGFMAALRQADEALYKAKAEGKNQVVFYPA